MLLKVVEDRGVDFEEVWGHKFAMSRAAKQATSMVEVAEKAADDPEVWLCASIHAAIVVQLIFSLSGAYHCLSAIGFLSGVFVWRHRSTGPTNN